MKKSYTKIICILMSLILLSSVGATQISALELPIDEFVGIERDIEKSIDEIRNDLRVVQFSATEQDEVEISTVEELVEYRNNINSGISVDAILTANIDLSGYCGQSWLPIGSESAPFSARFNGNGHVIRNLYISSNDVAVQGLFGCVSQSGSIEALTVRGNITSTNAAGIVGQLDGTIQNCTNECVVLGTDFAGGIAVINNGVISECSNNGYIKASSGIAGGIAACGEAGEVADCTNTASVHGKTGAAGIVGTTKCMVADCVNVGEVYASSTLAGGIVAKAENIVKDSVNKGVVSGKQYVGGICGRTSADICNVKNYGEIYASSSYAGGIVGYVSGGTSNAYTKIQKCVNYADAYMDNLCAGIAGMLLGYVNVESCYNYGDITSRSDVVAGIVGKAGNWDAKYYIINKSANYGRIETGGNQYYMGGICGRLTVGEINNSYNAGSTVYKQYTHGGVVGNAGNTTKVSNSFNYSSCTVNFSSSVCENTYMLSSTNSGNKRTAASFSNGTVLELLNNDTVWVQGEKFPIHIDEPREDGISTSDELIKALENSQLSEITLSNDINIDDTIKVSRNVVINGNNHSIIAQNGIFKIDGGATLELRNIALKGNDTLISATNSRIILSGIVNLHNYICTGILAENTEVVFSEDALFTSAPGEICISTNVLQDMSGVYNVEESESRYLYYVGNSETVYSDAAGFVIKAENNNGLSYDVYSLNKVYKNYIMVPSCASVKELTYTELDANGNQLATYTKDFSNETEFSVKLGYLDCKLLAMQSGLPTLYVEVDESYGTIDAMHSDPEHDTKAYGQMQIDVPAELAEKYGWEKVYKSKEGDEENPGSMEIKGRGNSTWNTTPGVKKPYQVKSEKKVDFLGMGKAKTWCLIMDNMRYVEQKFGLDLGEELGINGTPDSRFVEMYMNGEYYGCYVMCEKVEIKEERVEITDLEDEVDENGVTANTDLTGGYLLEIDNYSTDPIQVRTSTSLFTVKSPENLDGSATSTNNYGYIYNYIQEFMNAITGDGKMKDGSSYLDHIDVESFAKYYWHQEYIANMDCGLGSTYFYKDSDKKDHKLYAGPIWDSDNMLRAVEGWYVKNRERYDGADTIYNQLLQRKDFTSYVVWYYENEVRDVLKNATNLLKEYQQTITNADDMDYIKWGKNTFNSGNSMIQSLEQRFSWIDQHYTELLEEATKGNVIDVESVLNTTSPYTINSVKITDTTGNEFDVAPSNTSFVVDVNLTTSVNRGKADKVIVACYDEFGKMITVNSEDVSIPSKTALSTKVNMSVGNSSQIKYVKVFVWTDLTNIVPLCDIKEIRY